MSVSLGLETTLQMDPTNFFKRFPCRCTGMTYVGAGMTLLDRKNIGQHCHLDWSEHGRSPASGIIVISTGENEVSGMEKSLYKNQISRFPSVTRNDAFLISHQNDNFFHILTGKSLDFPNPCDSFFS